MYSTLSRLTCENTVSFVKVSYSMVGGWMNRLCHSHCTLRRTRETEAIKLDLCHCLFLGPFRFLHSLKMSPKSD